MESNKQHNEKLKFSREVEIAGLLHDIGKFIQRSQDKPVKKHSVLSSEFIDEINLPSDIDSSHVQKLIKEHHTDGELFPGHMDLKTADWASAAMDREKDEDSESNRMLESVFSSIWISKEETLTIEQTLKDSIKGYYLPTKADPKNHGEELFPLSEELEKSENVKGVHSIWKEFMETIKQIPEDLKYKEWISIVETLLKIYSFNILSAGYFTKPNVGLYHHLSTTAAIARSTSYYNLTFSIGSHTGGKAEPRHLIIKGDISGIQSFIFQVKTPEDVRKGTSKRLRGRSFSIQMLTDAIIYNILERLHLSSTSILTNAAGNFTLLVPNVDEVVAELSKLKEEISKYMKDHFQGILGLSLKWLEASNEDLTDYSTLEQKLSNLMIKEKSKPINALLLDSSQEHFNSTNATEFFSPQKVKESSLKCKICERVTENISSICSQCKQYEEIGKALPLTRWVVRKSAGTKTLLDNELTKLSVLDVDYLFVDDKNCKKILSEPQSDIDIIFSDVEDIKDYNLLKAGKSISLQFFGTSLPVDMNKVPLSFDVLCDASIGLKRYGVLKADLDNLGRIIIEGFDEKESKRSLAKLKDLSTRLELFFSGYLSELAREPEFSLWFGVCDKHIEFFNGVHTDSSPDQLEDSKPLFRYDPLKDEKQVVLECLTCKDIKRTTAIYSVFAGGDDVAFVGPWDMIIEFAVRLREKFKRYVTNNPWMTISAGIGLYPEKFPISRALSITEELLEYSKNRLQFPTKDSQPKDDSPSKPIKNSITLFGDTMLWEIDKDVYDYHDVKFGDFHELLKASRILSKDIVKDSNLSKSFVYILNNLWSEVFQGRSFESVHESRLKELSFYPRLAYYVCRRYPKGEREDKLISLGRIMPWMRVVSSIALYRSRSIKR